jgi:hypothetical protein
MNIKSKTLLSIVTALIASASLAGGDIAPRDGILVSVKKDGDRLVTVDSSPIRLNLRGVSSSLEKRLRESGNDGSMSSSQISRQLEKLPDGAVYLVVRGYGGGVKGIIPMREIRSFASHSEFGGNRKLPLSDTTQYWANPRISLENTTVSLRRKTALETQMLGPVRISMK